MAKEKAAQAENQDANTDTTQEPAPAPATETQSAPATEAVAHKSIVPRGWKSKEDALAKFINEQCTGKDGFQWPAFFQLMRENIGGTLTEDKIAHYEGQVNAKINGAPGRAKMTLRNMLATNVRKNGKAIGLDKKDYPIDLPKPAATGAAKAAQEKAAETAAAAQ